MGAGEGDTWGQERTTRTLCDALSRSFSRPTRCRFLSCADNCGMTPMEDARSCGAAFSIRCNLNEPPPGPLNENDESETDDPLAIFERYFRSLLFFFVRVRGKPSAS